MFKIGYVVLLAVFLTLLSRECKSECCHSNMPVFSVYGVIKKCEDGSNPTPFCAKGRYIRGILYFTNISNLTRFL